MIVWENIWSNRCSLEKNVHKNEFTAYLFKIYLFKLKYYYLTWHNLNFLETKRPDLFESRTGQIPPSAHRTHMILHIVFSVVTIKEIASIEVLPSFRYRVQEIAKGLLKLLNNFSMTLTNVSLLMEMRLLNSD